MQLADNRVIALRVLLRSRLVLDVDLVENLPVRDLVVIPRLMPDSKLIRKTALRIPTDESRIVPS